MNNPESVIFCGTTEIAFWDENVSHKNKSQIKLFKIELSKYYDVVDILFKTLTPFERQKAERYRFIKDRNRFIICRGLLKYLLAKEAKLDISQIHFAKHSNHKPYFPLDTYLFFNVAHAGDYAIIAIGDCELGVDIEMIDPSFDYSEILTTVFNETETDHIRNSKNKSVSFYKFWTRKEAIVKAIGKGIDDDLLKIPVTDGSHSVTSSLIGYVKKINVFNFHVTDDYVGALAFMVDMNDFDKIIFYPLPTSNDIISII